MALKVLSSGIVISIKPLAGKKSKCREDSAVQLHVARGLGHDWVWYIY